MLIGAFAWVLGGALVCRMRFPNMEMANPESLEGLRKVLMAAIWVMWLVIGALFAFDLSALMGYDTLDLNCKRVLILITCSGTACTLIGLFLLPAVREYALLGFMPPGIRGLVCFAQGVISMLATIGLSYIMLWLDK